MKMKALVIERPEEYVVKEVVKPGVQDDEVRIRVEAAGICGTDIHIYRGEYLGGYPIIPGHEFAGIVDEIGSQVTRFKKGDRVAVEPNISCNNCRACLSNRQNFCHQWQAIGVTQSGGMAQYTVAPEAAVFSIGDLSYIAGSFVEPLSCVIHGIERVGVALGDRVLILGAGPIGNLILQTVFLQGAAEVAVVESNPGRLHLAERTGNIEAYKNLDTVREDYYDVVIDATGVNTLMNKSISYVRKGGKILLFGVPNAAAVLQLPAFAFFEKGVSVMSSYTSVRNSIQAIELLRNGTITVDALISHQLPLEQFGEAIQLLEEKNDEVLKVLLKPWA